MKNESEVPKRTRGRAARADATTPRRERRPTSRGAGSTEHVSGLSPMGVGLGVAGAAVVVLGLWLVSRGDMTAAPLLLVLAYLVLFPLALVR
ncbi:MAG: hypothetical protein EA350_05595 [Gemmatimonadales bacterium]|nr:MAG: hypothetical protein EA350_05595 [Gemmatimonadales bacterium]